MNFFDICYLYKYKVEEHKILQQFVDLLERLEELRNYSYYIKIKTSCTVIFLYCTNICFCVLMNQHTSTGFCKKIITVMKE